MVSTFWLSFHAPYQCRHSGACCSSGWDIAVEKSRATAIGGIAPGVSWLRTVNGAPDDVAGVLERRADGQCVFHAEGCRIQSALGHDAIPLACQHFPRVCLIDSRGVFVTLSHYCPTAASLLLATNTAPVTIVEGPPALPGGAVPEGLDAREELPPLRTPRLLMDLDEYGAWERLAVEVLTTVYPAERAIDELSSGDAFVFPDRTLFEIARDAVPAPHSWPDYMAPVGGELDAHHAVVGRYLAAHAFASWMAYQGNGLHSTLMSLRLVLAVLRVEMARRGSLVESVRQSDLLLRHLADREALATAVSSLAR